MIRIRDQITADQIGENVWRTKNGQSYKWREMTITHLRNSSKLLSRRAIQEMTLIDLGIVGRHHQDAVMQMSNTADMMHAYADWRVAHAK